MIYKVPSNPNHSMILWFYKNGTLHIKISKESWHSHFKEKMGKLHFEAPSELGPCVIRSHLRELMLHLLQEQVGYAGIWKLPTGAVQTTSKANPSEYYPAIKKHSLNSQPSQFFSLTAIPFYSQYYGRMGIGSHVLGLSVIGLIFSRSQEGTKPHGSSLPDRAKPRQATWEKLHHHISSFLSPFPILPQAKVMEVCYSSTAHWASFRCTLRHHHSTEIQTFVWSDNFSALERKPQQFWKFLRREALGHAG